MRCCGPSRPRPTTSASPRKAPTRPCNWAPRATPVRRPCNSCPLPLLPESFMSLFGAQSAGIANPVNPLLEPAQIAEILRAANTKVLVTMSAQAGPELWAKVERIRKELPELKAIVVLKGPGNEADRVYSYEQLAAAQPADRLISGRRIAAGDTAAYFHTG